MAHPYSRAHEAIPWMNSSTQATSISGGSASERNAASGFRPHRGHVATFTASDFHPRSSGVVQSRRKCTPSTRVSMVARGAVGRHLQQRCVVRQASVTWPAPVVRLCACRDKMGDTFNQAELADVAQAHCPSLHSA